MALYSLRLRRTLTSLSTLHRSLSAVPAISTAALQSSRLQGPTSTSTPSHPWDLLVQSRPFRSTTVALFSARSTYNSNNTEDIGPDTILFEGCDYNHWLIVMSFPKEDRPTPQEMVQAYEETCATGLNIRSLSLSLSLSHTHTHTHTHSLTLTLCLMSEEIGEKVKNMMNEMLMVFEFVAFCERRVLSIRC